MTELTRRIVGAIKAIPKGRVASYGQIAEIVEHKGSARQVSWTLRTQTAKHDLPWHRVINSQGAISLKNEDGMVQKQKLEAEGVEVDERNRIDLEKFGWRPTPPEIITILRKT